RLGRDSEARAELESGQRDWIAAEVHLALGQVESSRACALEAYRKAWADGSPHIFWYELERSRDLLKRLGEPEPQLPPLDPARVPPIPYEAEIRAAIAKLEREKKEREKAEAKAKKRARRPRSQ